MSRIVYMGAHSILEYDEVKLLHSLGHEVFSIGAYIHPSRPLDDIRPPLPEVPEIPECIAAVDALGQQGHADTLMAAKDMGLPDAILDWAEIIIVAALEHRWLGSVEMIDGIYQPTYRNWRRLKDKRVIWRTIGQSATPNEWMMQTCRREGLQIVRYSPKERNIPEFAGEDALIRFGKDPDEWKGWTGDGGYVGNVTQFLYKRSLADDGLPADEGLQWTHWSYWEAATKGLPRKPAGPGSEVIGGTGGLDYDDMRQYLRDARCYVFCGTQPAAYTLGLIEAMMVGVPTFSITPDWYKILPYGSQMFEGHELALGAGDAESAHSFAQTCLNHPDWTPALSEQMRARAIDLFGIEGIAKQWADFLGVGVPEEVAA